MIPTGELSWLPLQFLHRILGPLRSLSLSSSAFFPDEENSPVREKPQIQPQTAVFSPTDILLSFGGDWISPGLTRLRHDSRGKSRQKQFSDAFVVEPACGFQTVTTFISYLFPLTLIHAESLAMLLAPVSLQHAPGWRMLRVTSGAIILQAHN